jgi:hypothetical protein
MQSLASISTRPIPKISSPCLTDCAHPDQKRPICGVLSHIREFLDNHPEIAQDSIKQTLAYFVSHLRYPEGDRYVDDQFAMANYLKETLSLEKVLDLLMMEIRLRFSYTEDDKSVNFMQKYLRWDSLASLKSL